MSRSVRVQRPSGRAAAGAAGLVVAGVLLVVAALAVPDGLPVWLSGAGAVGGAVAGTLLRRSTRQREGDHTMWRWSGAAAWLLAAALAAEAGAGALGLFPGVAFTAGGIAAAAALYHALVHWNRFRSAISDPGDWLNGISAVVALLALGNLLVRQAPGGAPWWGLQLGMLRVSVLLVVLGTASTVLVIAGLRGDSRVKVLVAGVAGAAAVELVGLAHTGPTGAPAPVAVATWTALVLLVAALRVGPARALPPREASSQDTTVGAVVVMVAGIGVLVVGALAPGDHRVASVLAAVAATGGGVRVVRLVRDLAQLALVRQEARTDPLTGVGNRRALVEAVEAVTAGGEGALLVIDLDRFKDVNDRFGHTVGDGVIRTVAARIEGRIGARGFLARLGGDEFAAVLHDPDPVAAVQLAEALCATVTEPVTVEHRRVQLEASIGVASTALGARRPGELLRRADAAMYSAKQAGGGVRLYDEAADSRAQEERELLDALRGALDPEGDGRHGALTVHFQPQVDARSGRVVGAEALVRWAHPDRGLLPPAAFLDLAEGHGLMPRLTWHVLDQATRAASGWALAGHDLRVAVNLSTSSLVLPGLLEVVDGALARSGLPPDRLVMEITETSLMHDPDLAVDVTRRLAARGIGISIDDYGTGYSSLAYLNDLPAEELKLDRSFTARATTDPRTRAIVSGTVELAHHLGLRLIAEGVEDEATRALLDDLGCDRTQGYLHGRPVPAEEFGRWLAAHDPRAHEPATHDPASVTVS
ncbi:putative bifunctional diguanylate cyclase/phosphodiesterase [Cellulomonas endometrii]|uniref:putative bifunctional diguanylate cyclase/phosphodiesterase n=1 Tax=Cellulomonas endometrii TaxID=3036301 RepID=UPI0024AD6C14|nr:bifunctional diguanylate cyclase/phosphodiesterase [Cellulomonas endometrii]